MAAEILIIEDEPTLSKLLAYNLTREGYIVQVADHGREGLEEALRHAYDLIVLDIMLPGLNGFEILDYLRLAGNRTPVIILTSRNAEDEVVQGLSSGADDYMTKPFSIAELFARVSAVLRRTSSGLGSVIENEPADKVILLGNLKIYPSRYEAYLNGVSIPLRPKEFEVLIYLVERPGVVVTRDQLMNAVWGYDYFGGQRTVDVHLSALRKKLEVDQGSVRIESIRSVGYKLVIHGIA